MAERSRFRIWSEKTDRIDCTQSTDRFIWTLDENAVICLVLQPILYKVYKKNGDKINAAIYKTEKL